MSDLDRPRLALYVALGAVVCFLGARYVAAHATRDAGRAGATVASSQSERQPPAATAGVRVGRAGGGRVTVHVAGAVRRPGVYRLGAGARVGDALRRAGGARPRADLDAVNLAAKLEDGRQVLVPVRGPAVATGAAAAGVAAAPGGTAAAPAQPVNLNTATLEQLDTLDGVGPGIAQRILDFREQRGGFRSVDELAEVPGIGPKRLATLRPLVTL